MAAKPAGPRLHLDRTLDRELARRLEPRAPAPQRRLRARRRAGGRRRPGRRHRRAGDPAAHRPATSRRSSRPRRQRARATRAGRMLRLPREVAPLFRAWLDAHYPLRAAHVMSLVRQIRGGRDNESRFGARMRGQGEFADLIRERFALACRRLGLDTDRDAAARHHAVPPATSGAGRRSGRAVLSAGRRSLVHSPRAHAGRRCACSGAAIACRTSRSRRSLSAPSVPLRISQFDA